MFQNLPFPAAQEIRDIGGVVPYIVMKNVGSYTTKCRRFHLSPRDYDLPDKVKGLLQETRYNTREELIRAIGRSIRNINKDGRADGVRLPNIKLKVINKGETILKVHKCCSPVNKVMPYIELLPLHFIQARRAGSDGSIAASGSAGPGFDPRRGSKL